MVIGSFRLPNDPASKSVPPLGASFPGSAPARLASRVATTTATRVRSRRLGIAMHRRVDVAQQPHLLRADLHLHAATAHVEGAPVDGHVAR